MPLKYWHKICKKEKKMNKIKNYGIYIEIRHVLLLVLKRLQGHLKERQERGNG